MRIDILSGIPDQLHSPLTTSIVKRARDKGLVEIHVHNIRDYATDKHRSIDDTPYGGGAGMVLKVEPIAAAIRKLQAERSYDEVIFLSPDGEVLTQTIANELSLQGNLILLAGHYKGIDQRVRDLFVTREISIGDYVLSGGELPALVVTDAIVRLLPGVLGDETSALSDSFQSHLLDAPCYTRPADWEGHKVPEVLLGGNHAAIDRWRDEQAYAKTKKRRPDLLQD
ncbi:MAG: tRNA (guanosine(37)-N1)-methyltransferase TrmD [Bacteroidota bacterium]